MFSNININLGSQPSFTIELIMYKSDNFCYRLIVGSLAGSIMISLTFGMALSVMGKEIPPLFVVIGSNAIGAISGLLAPSPSEKEAEKK
jgi:hypothetical protein